MNPTRQGLNQLLKIWILCLFCKSVISSYYICQFCYFCNKWFELIVFICDFCIQVLDVKRLIVIICPNILVFRILKIPSATPGDNLILWTSAVRSLTGPDSLVGWPQICGCYVISLPPKWGAPWGTLCYHSLIVGPFFRRLFVTSPSPWIFQVFIFLNCISWMEGPIDMVRKGCVLIECWTHVVTFNVRLTHDLDLGLSRSHFEKSHISGMGWSIDMERKGRESIECWTHVMTFNFDLTHDLDLGVSR